jgi:protein-L-isoaspartate(D-aspartate) O-methyltransferase
MTDFAKRRLNMVNAQLATNGIHSEALLESYKTLPRETLVDDLLRPFVYVDEDMTAGGKRFLLEPLVEARMVQEAIREQGASVLFLSATNLPAAAMLAQFMKSVTILEPDAKIVEIARARLAAARVKNVTVIETGYKEGYDHAAPYDVIFVPGAMAGISPTLTDQLAVGGCLVCVLRETPRAQGRIVVARKMHDGGVNNFTLADAATPYLAGFEPSGEFVF